MYEKLLDEREQRIVELTERCRVQAGKIDILVASYTQIVEGMVMDKRGKLDI